MEDRTNAAIFTLLIGVAGTIYAAKLAYWPWFKPSEWRKRTRRYRQKVWINWWFTPEAVFYKFLENRPKVDLWYARIGYLIMFVVFLFFTIWFYLSLSYFLN